VLGDRRATAVREMIEHTRAFAADDPASDLLGGRPEP
jgi:hypothetical protein